MATNINQLVESDVNIQLKENPTYIIFGEKIDKVSTDIFITAILLFTLIVFFINKNFKIFTKYRSLIIIWILFVMFAVFNIFSSSTKSGDVLFEQEKYTIIQDNIVFMIGILTIIIFFLINIAKYLSDDSTIIKILMIIFIFNIISMINISTVQSGDSIRFLRKAKEGLYAIIIFLLILILTYGYFSMKTN